MGEKKRKWLALRNLPCACKSGKAAEECCWTPKGWFRSPTKIDLRNTGHSGSHKRCYLRHLGTCSEKLSGEHPISSTVLKAIGEEKLRVTGTPWLPKGETREVGINSLVSNCLCEAHNHALSALDNVAGIFYRGFQQALLDDVAPIQTQLFSGHDIERWLLKTTAGLAASKYLGTEGERLPGDFASGIDVATLLEDPTAWRSPMGMFAIIKLGQTINVANELQIAPLTNHNREIGGLLTMIHGFTIALLLERKESLTGSSLERAMYRADRINAQKEHGQQVILLSWIKRSS